ncbi:hypothetical protein M407DRAFT_33493 [Tulasnella calospora MUT 4182]|uniref:Uncharacterized protein n=1 Tax=Tulasnella calospora MUT 4182 TaxID=1051891 RepID=A0A0C3K677_9AGAM|nr:hypothetical protein M407DRAFT_33493 [Tulasnella calospora MUT 4182]
MEAKFKASNGFPIHEESNPGYWPTLHNFARKTGATASHAVVEELVAGQSTWTATVMYALRGNISSWTAVASDKRTAREDAARKALMALSAGPWSPDGRHEPSALIFQRFDLVRELECLQAESIPATKEIVNALLALAEAIPKVIRNKHKLYRSFFCVRDICAELHKMPNIGNESTNWIRVLDDLTETLDSLTRIVTNIVQIIGQEMMPFELSSLQSWNHSCATLKDIAEELSKDALRLNQVPDAFEAEKDDYFDDCSWLSRIFHEGIAAAIERTYLPEDNVPAEVKRFVEILEDFVDKVKLMGVTGKPFREVVIRITSDVANVAITSLPKTMPAFWVAASSALQLVKTDNSVTPDLADTLSLNWSQFSELWITPDRVLNAVVTQASKDEPSTISLSKDLIHLEREPTPATEQVVVLLREIGKVAITVRCHKHKVYSIVLRARDICNYILRLGECPENQQPTDAKSLLGVLDEYSNIIEALERELKKFSEILLKEKAADGPEARLTWSQSRAAISDIQVVLNQAPFNAISLNPSQDTAKDSFFDDCSWISLLLHDDVEPAIARQFPNPENVHEGVMRVKEVLNHIENEIKQGNHEEAFRQLVIDILTRLSETMSLINAASLSHEGNPLAPWRDDRHWLFDSLSDKTYSSSSCSAIDLHSALQSTDIQELGQKWSKISGALDLRRGGRMFKDEVSGSAQLEPPEFLAAPEPEKTASSIVAEAPSRNTRGAPFPMLDSPLFIRRSREIQVDSHSSNPRVQYCMQLNLIEQAGHAKFDLKASDCSAIPAERLLTFFI